MTLRTVLTCVLRFHHSHDSCLDPTIVSVSMLMSESLVIVSAVWLLGRELSFVICLHYSLKKSLNRFVSSKKPVTNSLFTRSGGINGSF